MSVGDRIKHVERFVRRMIEVREEVVNMLMWEIGKTRSDSEKEFDRTVEYINQTIKALKDLDHDSAQMKVVEGIIAQVRRAPLGVVLCMGPYNYPLNEIFTTLVPALLMGNTIIFKPAKFGVLLHRPLLEAFRDCFPAGVVNVIYGDGPTIITPIMESGKVDVLAFIGSDKVAHKLVESHPRTHHLRRVLGLGANNPAIILDDADIDLTVKEVLTGALSFNGQRCTALKKIFVDRRCVDQFVQKFLEELAKLKFGMPWESGVSLTPLPELTKSEYLTGLVEDAVNKGARVVNECGGMVNGSYFHPAVLLGVTDQMRVWNEEQFGPVVPIIVFDNVNEPINYMINSDYGQQVSIFGNDPRTIGEIIDKASRLVSRINVDGQCQRGPDPFPFTGRKDSAEGTLSITDALLIFSICTMVTAKLTDENKKIITSIVNEGLSLFLSNEFLL